jgi:3-deoxy-D-manno-octulosonic-acid transferase
VVAGSTWPADHAVLLPACDRLRNLLPQLQLVIAPHEPTPQNVTELLAALSAAGWQGAALAEVERAGGSDEVDAIVVDRLGVLAQLYLIGDVAYVGGGFHGRGLHSVLEPAAAARPVCFGPRHHDSRAAGELIAAGGAAAVDGVAGLTQQLSRWLSNRLELEAAGRAAHTYIEGHRGAADRSARLLLELLREQREPHSP